MPTRRELLELLTYPAAAALTSSCFAPDRAAHATAAFAAAGDLTPQEAAEREDLWVPVQQAFTVDRSQINLNNGGVSPAPAIVQDAHKQRLDFSNQNSTRNLWTILEPQKENVRAALARLFGSDKEEIAITRNASESLENCLLGFDLKRGDEVVTTDQDYPRMLTTLEQRVRRDGIVLQMIAVPVPCEDFDEIVRRFEAAITARTRLILVCHVINITGQIMPVRRIVELGRKRGIPVIVDGAHAFAHLVEKCSDLDCDYYGTSLHKWLFAPHGTGMLYVRRDKIRSLWPLMPAPATLDADIRKFEEIGTHPAAQILSIGEALAFHLGIGPERKLARMRLLRDRWAVRLAKNERVRLNTSLKPEYAGGVANFRVEGLDMKKLQQHLWDEHKIWTVYIGPPLPQECEGLRITPSVYTTLDELDRFCEAVEGVLGRGLPA
ncbi:MAG TPA: aminotransferase class V-fold PLP-dependent enzyme [Planctomycetota bacterium]|nr:aminotransferase class V-fold PLP-dependent enzyme [Planctomycetota bacterium]